jgi:hypothetical protein
MAILLRPSILRHLTATKPTTAAVRKFTLTTTTMASAATIYDFSPLKPSGEPLPMKDLKGKVVLLVNVASKYLSPTPHLLSILTRVY